MIGNMVKVIVDRPLETYHPKTMSTIEITSKIEALKELEALIEEAKAEAEALRDDIKQEMMATHNGTFTVGTTPRKSSSRKYACPCCGRIV